MGLFGGGGGGIGGGVGRVGGGGFRPGGMFSGGGAPMMGGGAPMMGGSPIGGMFGGGMRGGGMPGMMPRPQIAQPGVRPQQAPRPQIAVPQQQNLPKAGQAVAPPVAPPPTPTMAPTPMLPSKGPTLLPPQPGRGFPTTPQPTPPMVAQPGVQSVGQLPPLTQGHHQMGKDQSQLTPPPQMTQRHGLGGRFGEGMYPGNGPSTVMQPQVAPFQPGKTGVMPTAHTPIPVGPPPARPGMVPQQIPQVPPQAARPVPPAGPGMVPQPLPRGQGLTQPVQPLPRGQAGLPPPTKLPSVAPRTVPSVGPGMAQTASMPGVVPMTQQAAQLKPIQASVGGSSGMFGALKQAAPGDVGAMPLPPPPTKSPGAPEPYSPKQVSYSFGKGTVRNRPVKGALESNLGEVAHSYGVEAVIHSGGQAAKGSGGRRVKGSSVRHDHGGAADLKFRKPDGTFLSMNNPADREVMGNIITDMTRRGYRGVGAAPDYMGPNSMHIGGGTTFAWGRNGESENAPAWLKAAHSRGLR